MPDPLTVLLDAIWIEARWQLRVRLFHTTSRYRAGRYVEVPQDSISGRNVFWVSVMEGRE